MAKYVVPAGAHNAAYVKASMFKEIFVLYSYRGVFYKLRYIGIFYWDAFYSVIIFP